jgi:hypothetical protein
MDRKQTLTCLAALLTSLADGGAPSGAAYAAFNSKGVTLDEYQALLAMLTRTKLVTESGAHWLELTPHGKETADRINAALQS